MQEHEIIDDYDNGDRILGKTKKRIRRNKEYARKTRKLFLKKSLILLFASLLILSIPITYACINPNNNWHFLSDGINTNYNNLSKESIDSISDFNKDNDYIIHYFRDAIKKDSYLLKFNDKNALLEEHYIYDGIEISLYITHKNSNVFINDFINKYKNNLSLSNYKIKYYHFEENYYLETISGYKYQIKIHTSDFKIVKKLINNFK